MWYSVGAVATRPEYPVLHVRVQTGATAGDTRSFSIRGKRRSAQPRADEQTLEASKCPLCDVLDRLRECAHHGRMSQSSVLEERIQRQASELLAIIRTEPEISTAELAFRTGMSDGVVRKRLAHLRSEGKITGRRGRARPTSVADLPPLSIEERVGTIERLLLKLLDQQDKLKAS
jgi:Winged helix-turn-helix DNA-binding